MRIQFLKSGPPGRTLQARVPTSCGATAAWTRMGLAVKLRRAETSPGPSMDSDGTRVGGGWDASSVIPSHGAGTPLLCCVGTTTSMGSDDSDGRLGRLGWGCGSGRGGAGPANGVRARPRRLGWATQMTCGPGRGLGWSAGLGGEKWGRVTGCGRRACRRAGPGRWQGSRRAGPGLRGRQGRRAGRAGGCVRPGAA
jgi:hypothetical protein